MIRIDEIYDSVFAPWITTNRPNLRMFYFWPFGRTDVEAVSTHCAIDRHEHNYIVFLDQEPIDIERQRGTFEHLGSIGFSVDREPILVTSEQNSANVRAVCEEFGYRSLYYFFHGWAAMDWYRGYDRSYLMPDWPDRKITTTFICPNRIIGGTRTHRVLMMYWFDRYGLTHNHISFPDVCPVEDSNIVDLARPWEHQLPDIVTRLCRRQLPINFKGESGQPMHSYRLSLFDESAESLVYVVTETLADSRCLHLTEKIFKPICLKMPFMVMGTPGSLEYLKSYGFRTFDKFWDESYDLESNVVRRSEMIAIELARLDRLTRREKQDLFESTSEIIEHNFRHFYQGGFESVLNKELQDMIHAF